MRHYYEMNTIMKCIICYSRLDFRTHSLRRFSYTEFPWAVRALCWCKREQKLLLLFVYSQHTSPLGEASTLCVCLCYSPRLGGGCLFQWKLSAKNAGQMLHFAPSAARIKGVQCPKIQMAWWPWAGHCVHVNTWACGSVCRAHGCAEERPCYASGVPQALFRPLVSSIVRYLCTLIL